MRTELSSIQQSALDIQHLKYGCGTNLQHAE